MLPHTGMPWFNVAICVVSGLAGARVAWLFPKYIKEQWEFWSNYWDSRG